MQMCANFTVTPVPKENGFVILIVGGLIIGLGVIPLAVSVFHQSYQNNGVKKRIAKDLLSR